MGEKSNKNAGMEQVIAAITKVKKLSDEEQALVQTMKEVKAGVDSRERKQSFGRVIVGSLLITGSIVAWCTHSKCQGLCANVDGLCVLGENMKRAVMGSF